MSTAIQPTLQFTQDKIQAHRETKRRVIEKYFMEHLLEPLSSRALHIRYGSSVRTRISEINRDEHSEIRIRNEVIFTEGFEQSSYWSVRK